jgi:PKD repeat protein
LPLPHAGQVLAAAWVAFFHDNEPGMATTDYTARIAWGDGSPDSTGQVWTVGGGNWVATDSHTYADVGNYSITVTITDTHPGGMTTTATSSVLVTDSASPPGGYSSPGGALLRHLVAVLPHDMDPVRLDSGEQANPAQAEIAASASFITPFGTRGQGISAVFDNQSSSVDHRATHATLQEPLDRFSSEVLELLAVKRLR